MRVRAIVTHNRPHLDEIAAIVALRTKEGLAKYPGVDTAQILIWGKDFIMEDGRSVADYEQEGHLFLGVGGGRFDEHPNGDEQIIRQDECCLSLVLRDLGLSEQDRRPWELIEEFVKDVDNNPTASPFDISSIVKNINAEFPNNPHMAIDWVMTALQAKCASQLRFFKEAGPEYRSKAKIRPLKIGDRKINLVVIKSDIEGVAKFARLPEPDGCRAAVVILQQSSGRTQIFTNRREKLNMDDVAKALRLEEQIVRGKVIITDWKTLSVDGTVEDIPWWHYQKRGPNIFNGSLSRPDVKPTAIPLKRIEELVVVALTGEGLPHDCQVSGRCTKDACKWWKYTFYYCRQRQKK